MPASTNLSPRQKLRQKKISQYDQHPIAPTPDVQRVILIDAIYIDSPKNNSTLADHFES